MKIMATVLCCIAILLPITCTYGNDVSSSMNDSLRVVELLVAAKKISVDSSLELSQEALRLAQKTKLRSLEGLAYFQIGECFYLLNQYEESYQAFMEAKNVFSRIDKLQYALSLFHAGRAKKAQSKYADALENYLTALNILENIGDEKTTSSLYLDIADIYRFTKDLVKAETFAQKALALSSKNPLDKQGIASSQIALGNILSEKGDYEKALNLYLLAVRLLEESKDKKGIGFVLHSIGMMHAHQQRYRVATEYFLKSIEYKKELNDVLGMAQSYAHMSESYFHMARFQEGIMAGKKAIELAEKVRAYEIVQNVSKTLFQCYKLSGNLYKAIDAHERYVHLKDSLFSVEMGKELKRLQNNHEIYQKQKEIELLEKDKLLQEETIAMHALQRNILIIGILVILAFSWMMYRNMQKTKILNNTLILQKQEIEQQKEEILAQSEALKESNLRISQANDELNAMLNTVSEQKNIIEEKNRNIVDSLNYAKRIQTAMLPKGEEIAVFFPEHFVFFKPKDIVSGDFYWMAHTTAEPIYEERMTFDGILRIFKGFKSEKVLFAVADCTGHGVPGAFMSMIGHDILNQIVLEKRIYSPECILSELHKGIRHALKQDKNEIHDGMDIALIAHDRDNNTVEYAGAMNPLFYVVNEAIQEIKADRKPIGGSSTESEQVFTKHTIHIQHPTIFYLSSDGFQDQFGGKENRKFLVKNFRKMLLDIHSLPMEEQLQRVERILTEWIQEGNEVQLDDVTVVGLKISPLNSSRGESKETEDRA